MLPDGSVVLHDAGGLSDDPNEFSFFEGIPRVNQYEVSMSGNFTNDNFKRYFGTKMDARKPTSSPIVAHLH